jgi:hypothetical protein
LWPRSTTSKSAKPRSRRRCSSTLRNIWKCANGGGSF